MKKEKIREFVINAINVELKEYSHGKQINEDDKWLKSELHADLGLDSLNVVEIFLECENEFRIHFVDEEIMKTKTVGDLINKIQEKIN